MKRTTNLLGTLSLLAVAACDNPPVPANVPTSTASAAASTDAAVPTASAVASASATPATPPPPKAAVTFTGLSTPESVLYDAENDRYLVSNIGGKPLDVDGNGFISELTPDGGVKTLKWIESGKNKVKLDAPKGMAIDKGVLYVADITVVRTFDAKTGAPKGDIPIEGATFLNDVAAGNGKVYVSDSALKAKGDGFEPTGTDAVWVIEKGKATPLAKSTDLGKPNGLAVDGKNVIVVTFGSGEIYTLDEKGQKTGAEKLPKGSLDGLGSLNGTTYVSSWEGSAIYARKEHGTWAPVLEQLAAPADFVIDTKRNRIVVPRFLGGTVEAYDLPK